MLNAGAPILAVKTILGHRHIDTTMGYARLWDGTLAADYYRAMAEIENRFGSQDVPNSTALDLGHMLAQLRIWNIIRNDDLQARNSKADYRALHGTRSQLACPALKILAFSQIGFLALLTKPNLFQP